MTKKEVFELLARSFQTGIRSTKCKAGQKWLCDRKLDLLKTGIGFNSGQIHHRKSEQFKEDLSKVDFLKPLSGLSRTGNRAYEVLNPQSVVFPLKNEHGDTVNFFFEKLSGNESTYLNQSGIYPEYPHNKTQKLYITTDVLSAATILSADILENREALIALRENKVSKEIQKAIQGLNYLEQIILID